MQGQQSVGFREQRTDPGEPFPIERFDQPRGLSLRSPRGSDRWALGEPALVHERQMGLQPWGVFFVCGQRTSSERLPLRRVPGRRAGRCRLQPKGTEHPPDVPRMIANLTGFPNHLRHPLQGPQVRGVAPRRRSPQQGHFQPPPGRGIHARFSTGASGTLQPAAPAAPPSLIPAMRSGATDLQAEDNLGLRVTLGKQLGSLHPTSFQGRKISPRPQPHIHAATIPHSSVRLLLYYANVIKGFHSGFCGSRSP